VEHFYVEFGDPASISFEDIMWKNRQTDVTESPAVGVCVIIAVVLECRVDRLCHCQDGSADTCN